jgi:hypothetical protein
MHDERHSQRAFKQWSVAIADIVNLVILVFLADERQLALR